MADDGTGATDAETKGGGGALSVGELRQFIADTVTSLLKPVTGGDDKKTEDKDTGRTEDSATRRASIADEVKRELEKIKAREARDKRDTDIDDKLKALEAKTEHTPVERRRVHKLMGWGE